MSDGNSAVVDLLKSNDYFDKQDDSFYQKFAGLLKKKDLKDGEVLIKEGEHVDKLIVLEKGSLLRKRHNAASPDGEGVDIDRVGPPHALCMLHLLTAQGDPAYATVQAEGDSTVWQTSRDEFQKFLVNNPQYMLALMAQLAGQLRAGSKVLRVLAQQKSSDEANAFKGIRVLCYDSTAWVRDNFSKGLEAYNEKAADDRKIEFTYTGDALSSATVATAAGNQAICLFVNDTADGDVLRTVSSLGIKFIAMRCAGYDRVDCKTAETLGLTVARVPAYSPYAVAEHAITLLLTLNRKIHKAVSRVCDGNFTLDGLVGFDMHGKTVGVIGTGKIGQCLCNILLGFGVKLICYDVHPSDEVKAKGATYVDMDTVWGTSDVIFLMTPLFPQTHHMFNKSVLPKLKKGVYLINTSRGALIETEALIEGLRSKTIAGAGLDVYEYESKYFFRDHSNDMIEDHMLTDLLSFHNVLLTAHQAFFTQEAIDKIVSTTLDNINQYLEGKEGREHPNSIYT